MSTRPGFAATTPLNIHAEIPVADILALQKEMKVKHFICYHVAFMLHDQLMALEGFAKHHQNLSRIEFDSVPELQTKEQAEYEIRSAEYYYLDRTLKCGLDRQVVGQLHHWYEQIFGDEDAKYDTFIGDNQWKRITPQQENEYHLEYSRRVRIAFLEKIVEFDAQAVMTITL